MYLIIDQLNVETDILSLIDVLHSASLGASIWAIILGCLLRNILSFFQKDSNQQLPPWIKIAQQTELYIAISLVLLCIDISELKPLAPRALFVSWIDTPSLFMVVAYIGWRWMDIDKQTAIIMSGATFICGSSAAIALGSALGERKTPQQGISLTDSTHLVLYVSLLGATHKTDMPIAIVMILFCW